ncbi:MAG: HEPN domain-containing protein [Terracidiphilus sp.]
MSDLRLKEAKALLEAGFPEGAYYLAGYSVECALKACIAKRTREHDFPDKELANKSYTHDLAKLLKSAELEIELDTLLQADPSIRAKWGTTQLWNEESRYKSKTTSEAAELLKAIDDETGGMLPWIRARW